MGLKRVIAREWHYLAWWLLIVFVLLPLFLAFLGIVNPKAARGFWEFLDWYYSGFASIYTWIIWFAPYVLFLFVRSFLWAKKARR